MTTIYTHSYAIYLHQLQRTVLQPTIKQSTTASGLIAYILLTPGGATSFQPFISFALSRRDSFILELLYYDIDYWILINFNYSLLKLTLKRSDSVGTDESVPVYYKYAHHSCLELGLHSLANSLSVDISSTTISELINKLVQHVKVLIIEIEFISSVYMGQAGADLSAYRELLDDWNSIRNRTSNNHHLKNDLEDHRTVHSNENDGGEHHHHQNSVIDESSSGSEFEKFGALLGWIQGVIGRFNAGLIDLQTFRDGLSYFEHKLLVEGCAIGVIGWLLDELSRLGRFESDLNRRVQLNLEVIEQRLTVLPTTEMITPARFISFDFGESNVSWSQALDMAVKMAIDGNLSEEEDSQDRTIPIWSLLPQIMKALKAKEFVKILIGSIVKAIKPDPDPPSPRPCRRVEKAWDIHQYQRLERALVWPLISLLGRRLTFLGVSKIARSGGTLWRVGQSTLEDTDIDHAESKEISYLDV
ncbi:hypothetical protein KEM48_007044 [Puccinia striiformis f. sp. tritici PST-130]|nr:hypothetical protein KEM48_007044 [Puccinia striiformis f. sp. tritici PST-130]